MEYGVEGNELALHALPQPLTLSDASECLGI